MGICFYEGDKRKVSDKNKRITEKIQDIGHKEITAQTVNIWACIRGCI
jgi:hypothetical protein